MNFTVTNNQKRKAVQKAKLLLKAAKDPSHSRKHAERVVSNIRIIYNSLPKAQKGAVNLNILEIAAWYHDIAFREYEYSFFMFLTENFRSARLTKKHLQQIRFSKENIKNICNIIKTHSSIGKRLFKPSLAGKILIDADILDKTSPQRYEELRKVKKDGLFNIIRIFMANKAKRLNYLWQRKSLNFYISKQLLDKRGI
jgi:HD superfamily phosphodiesterase